MKQPHHTGHHGSNVITGTGRADTIFGGHGTADIHGWAGDDVLHAATQRIVSIPSVDGVVVRTAIQHIVASVSMDQIGAVASSDCVVA